MDSAYLALENDKIIENSPGIAKDFFALGLISKKAGLNTEAFDFFIQSYLIYKVLNLKDNVIKVVTYIIETGEILNLGDELKEYRQILKSLE